MKEEFWDEFWDAGEFKLNPSQIHVLKKTVKSDKKINEIQEKLNQFVMPNNKLVSLQLHRHAGLFHFGRVKLCGGNKNYQATSVVN